MEHVGAVVVGAGPAGIATALAASMADESCSRQLVVLDRAVFPRHKPCGGGLTRTAFEALGLLEIALAMPTIAIRTLVVRSSRSTSVFRRDEPFFHVVDRTEFDRQLVTVAQQRGVRVCQGRRVVDIRRSGEWIDVCTDAGVIRTGLVVGADGASSLVRRRLFPVVGRLGRLLETFVPAPSGWVDSAVFDLTPITEGIQGYHWKFPTMQNGYMQLNCGIYDSRAHPRTGLVPLMAPLFQRLTDLDAHRGDTGVAAHALRRWSAGARSAVAPGAMLVGDALGADGLLGEGISTALMQGMLAGRAMGTTGFRALEAVNSYCALLSESSVARRLSRREHLAHITYGPGGRALMEGAIWVAEVTARRRSGALAGPKGEVLVFREGGSIERTLATHAGADGPATASAVPSPVAGIMRRHKAAHDPKLEGRGVP